MLSQKPKVSVILPVYQGASLVEDAVDSILAQTFPDWELIAVDDGSKDNSFSVLEKLAKKDNRIRVYKNPQNIGLSATLNKAISMSEGEYIAIQEQDDFSTPNRLESEVFVLDKKPEVSLVSGIAEFLNDDLNPELLFPGLLARKDQYPQDFKLMFEYLYTELCKVVHAGCMYRGSIFRDDKFQYDEAARIGDWQLFLRISRQHHIWGLHHVVVRMRRGSGRESVTKNKSLQFSETRRCINLIRNEYKNATYCRVTFDLWRKAIASELILEARFYGRWRGLWFLFQAFILHPMNPKLWSTIGWFLSKAKRKLLGSAKIFRPNLPGA